MASRPGTKPGQRDLTSGPIGKTLLAFALPTLGSSILQSLNGSINAVWIGQFLGERALAATTNASIIMFLLVAAVFGFGMASTILIGQNMGRRDVDAVRPRAGHVDRAVRDHFRSDRGGRLARCTNDPAIAGDAGRGLSARARLICG